MTYLRYLQSPVYGFVATATKYTQFDPIADSLNTIHEAEPHNPLTNKHNKKMTDDGGARLVVKGRVLGNSSSTVTGGVLGQLSGQDESDSGLDLSRSDGGLLGVGGQLGGLGGDSLEDIVDKGVHDGHGSGGDTGIGVGLLQHLVDVRRVGLLSGLGSLLLLSGGGGGLLASLLLLSGSLSGGGLSGEGGLLLSNFRGHCVLCVVCEVVKLLSRFEADDKGVYRKKVR